MLFLVGYKYAARISLLPFFCQICEDVNLGCRRPTAPGCGERSGCTGCPLELFTAVNMRRAELLVAEDGCSAEPVVDRMGWVLLQLMA